MSARKRRLVQQSTHERVPDDETGKNVVGSDKADNTKSKESEPDAISKKIIMIDPLPLFRPL